MINKKEIIKINKELGGTLVRESSLDFACDSMKDNKNVFKRNACLIRAIVVDHPFDDFNKSTATLSTLREFKRNKIKCKEDSYLRGIRKIARENQTDLKIIERRLRKWCLKKK